MDYRGTEKEALQMLIDYELAIADLYAAYAERFPDHRDYWLLLSSEEKDHAEAIGKMLEIADQNQSGLKTAGFKPAAVNTSIAYLSDLTKIAKTTPIPIGDALSAALDLEKAMIEIKPEDIQWTGTININIDDLVSADDCDACGGPCKYSKR